MHRKFSLSKIWHFWCVMCVSIENKRISFVMHLHAWKSSTCAKKIMNDNFRIASMAHNASCESKALFWIFNKSQFIFFISIPENSLSEKISLLKIFLDSFVWVLFSVLFLFSAFFYFFLFIICACMGFEKCGNAWNHTELREGKEKSFGKGFLLLCLLNHLFHFELFNLISKNHWIKKYACVYFTAPA